MTNYSKYNTFMTGFARIDDLTTSIIRNYYNIKINSIYEYVRRNLGEQQSFPEILGFWDF